MDLSGYKYNVLFFPENKNNIVYKPIIYDDEHEIVNDVIYLGYIQQLNEKVALDSTISLQSTDITVTNTNWLRYVPSKGASGNITLPLRLVSSSRYYGTVVTKQGNIITIHTADITDANRVKKGMVAVLNNSVYANIMRDAEVVNSNTYRIYVEYSVTEVNVPAGSSFYTVDMHGEIMALQYAYNFLSQIVGNNVGTILIGLSHAEILKPDINTAVGICIEETAMFNVTGDYRIRKVILPHCVIKTFSLDDTLSGDTGLNYKLQLQVSL